MMVNLVHVLPEQIAYILILALRRCPHRKVQFIVADVDALGLQ
jgi:hypothetical protein